MVYLMPASECNCKICDGGKPAPPGVFGGSICGCQCHKTGINQNNKTAIDRIFEKMKPLEPTEDKMSDNEKCQNGGCHFWTNGLIANCEYYFPGNPRRTCTDFTATPTTSIPTAELKALQDKIANHEEAYRLLVNRITALQDKIAELEADALKWRALLSADRIRVLGSAGFPEQGSDNKTNYRHFGLDLWNGCEGVDGERAGAVEMLEFFVAAIDKARK